MSDTSELDATDNPVLNAACKRMADCAFDRIESYTVTLTRDECNAVLYCISNLEVDKQALRWDKTALQAEVKRLSEALEQIQQQCCVDGLPGRVLANAICKLTVNALDPLERTP